MFRSLLFMPCLALAAWGQAWPARESTLTGSTTSFNDGPGHAWADVDGDGDFDLVTNGHVRLWINRVNENGTFQQRPDLLPMGLAGAGYAAAFADFDNDGDADLHCGNAAADFLLENHFPDPFIDVAPAFGLTDTDWNQSVNWVDYNLDGRLDIYITHELPGVDGPHEFYESAYPAAFIPRFPAGAGADTFGLADRNAHAYGLTWADIDLDGDIDAVTSACGVADEIQGENPHNKIYRNKHPVQGFEDLSLATGLVTPQEVSDGSASYWAILFDYDGDPFPDLLIGRTNGSHRLWRNGGMVPGDFAIDLVPNSTHHLAGSGAFVDGACAGDIDNDGDLDIYATPNGLYLNNGDGSYTLRNDLVPAGGADASFVDYDRDGNLDLFNFQDLFNNPGGYGNHWLAVELEGDSARGTDRDAHHVKIKLSAGALTSYREHRFMVGTYSQHLLPTHFGLGLNDLVDELQITWPNGHRTLLEALEPDRYINVSQLDLEASDPVFTLNCETNLVTFTVTAFGNGPFSYQWRRDGMNLEGADGPQLSFVSTADDSGSYDCLIANADAVIIPNPIDYIHVALGLPSILDQPGNTVAPFGSSVSFSVLAEGNGLAYQWFKDDQELSGATHPALDLRQITGGDAGTYQCRVTNLCGQVTSEAATLCVLGLAYVNARNNWPATNVTDLVSQIATDCL